MRKLLVAGAATAVLLAFALPGQATLLSGSVPKKAVVSTPPNRSELIPSGMVIWARGWVAVVGVVLEPDEPAQQQQVGLQRRDAITGSFHDCASSCVNPKPSERVGRINTSAFL